MNKNETISEPKPDRELVTALRMEEKTSVFSLIEKAGIEPA
ncbi:hypothetical protein [Bacillus methanolicus]|uniref:Uncharacterized protein n=1 Tax=Bacillus methanolicus (strain MGA3 / ATCC 53907) TaxID=796606 RepID=I3E390_BACMM|nr:hypothetical protein [Bacillus methanolicus]AIE58950.1 hypothetical protein BMMGA3_02410 [Bacillus methanolicus MGA3]EIJ80961.1 hypothetical protein MGA3_11730 [Bacillus methanolicus MGA3]